MKNKSSTISREEIVEVDSTKMDRYNNAIGKVKSFNDKVGAKKDRDYGYKEGLAKVKAFNDQSKRHRELGLKPGWAERNMRVFQDQPGDSEEQKAENAFQREEQRAYNKKLASGWNPGMDMDIDQPEDTEEDRLEKLDYRKEKREREARIKADEDARLSKIKKRYLPVADQVDAFRDALSNNFNTIEEYEKLLSATYEVIGKRYFESKRKKDAYTQDWIKLVKDMPTLALTHDELNETTETVGDIDTNLVKMVEYEVRTPKDAVALLFAISFQIDELSAPGEGDTNLDDIIDIAYRSFDEKFKLMLGGREV